MTTYFCVQCDERFSLEAGVRARCPKCMRVHGLSEVDGDASTAQGIWRSRPLWLAAALFVLGAVTGLLFLLSRPAEPERPTGEEVLATLPAGHIAFRSPFAATSEVEKFSAEHGGSGALGSRLAAVSAGLGDIADRAGVALEQPRWEPRQQAPLLPSALLALHGAEGEPKALYSLEFCVAAVAALRSAGEDAVVAEFTAGAGAAVATPDPSGYLGYYGVAEAPATPSDQPQVRAYDPFAAAARGEIPEPLAPAADTAVVQILSDDEVVAALLGLKALHSLASEPAVALSEVDAALRLWPRSATLRSIRARTLALTAGAAEAERAADSALQLRADPPRHLHMATYLLEQGDAKAAQARLDQALALDGDFAPAQLLSAGLLAARGEVEQARGVVTRLVATTPDLPLVFLTSAQVEAAAGDLPAAIIQAEKALKRRPDAPEVYLVLAQLHLAAGDRDAMRAQLEQLLSVTAPGRKAEVEAQIKALFGPDAMAASETSGDEAPPAPSPPPAGDGRAPANAASDAVPSDLPGFQLSPGTGLLAEPPSASDAK